ncbi:SURF6-domain-containing protein [Tothia fuscella]|uniref:SURF6-domain-containing protein n=1 Tax=Tothia fuscella TaxID=1048955 RepID=A0A9P4P340_9PEZI|nr:SURF6-domain-containing protein [Tothia fuscella]
MADDLEARLQGHSQAFEGLLSLIPAKFYYDQDHTDDWQKKKQTPEERRLAKKAKLHPDAHKSARDVMEENERKRRREDEEEEAGDVRGISGIDGIDEEKPLQGLKAPKKKAQKQRGDQDVHSTDAKKAPKLTPKKSKEQRAKDKEQRQKARLARKEEKRQLKKAKREAASQPGEQPKAPSKKLPKEPTVQPEPDLQKPPKKSQVTKSQDDTTNGAVNGIVNGSTNDTADASNASEAEADDDDGAEEDKREEESTVLDNDMDMVDVTGLVPDVPADAQSSSPSSTSSILPPATEDTSKESNAKTAPSNDQPASLTADSKPDKKILTPEEKAIKDAEHAEHMARLRAKVEAYRKARKADGPDGKIAKGRGELIEARRLKEQKKKERKKEVRAEAREAEKKAEMEAELARLRGSPSIGSELFGGRASGSSSPTNNFSFGRVAFKDGQRVNSSLSGLVDIHKKGTSDPKTALIAAEKKKARLSGLDEAKRADIEEKDVWLNAKKKVNGERVRDDTNLLKKTLKRKEKTKLKSEKEWNERIEGVKKGQAFQQKKREENLAKRKEEKGSKGKSAKKGGAKKGGAKKKSRPGFEGSFKGRA